MIIYALAASGQASIGGLILAGLLPAILLSVCNLGAAYYVALKRGYPAPPRPAAGGAVPARLRSVRTLGAAYYVASKRGYPALPRPATEVIWRSIAAAVPGLLVLVVILGGIVSGILDPEGGSGGM